MKKNKKMRFSARGGMEKGRREGGPGFIIIFPKECGRGRVRTPARVFVCEYFITSPSRFFSAGANQTKTTGRPIRSFGTIASLRCGRLCFLFYFICLSSLRARQRPIGQKALARPSVSKLHYRCVPPLCPSRSAWGESLKINRSYARLAVGPPT